MRRLTTLVPMLSLALAGCVGDIGDDRDTSPDGPNGPNDFTCDPTASALTPSAIRRLPRTYFENSVRELLSPLDEANRTALLDALATRIDLIPADSDEHFTTNDASVSQDHVDAIFGVAVSLAAKVAEEPDYAAGLLAVCDGSDLSDDGCLTRFVEYYGRKAFRRPLTQAEVDDFKAFHAAALAEEVDGLAMLVGRFVAHPNFYYRFDSEGTLVDGTEGVDATYALTKWELLSKVTFLFWAAPPTDELYDFVEATDITQDEALEEVVSQVLASRKTELGILGFYREWLHLEKTKTPGTEGNVVAGAALLAAAGVAELPVTHREDMIQEVLELTRHYTLTTEGKLSDILTSQYSFARTDALASIYGVAPWNGDETALVELPKGERSGLITRAAFITSGAEYTRPIIKGELIRTRLLCQPVPPPPADLDIVPLTHPADKTTRQAIEEVTGGASCTGCHSKMNPLGFATESYDPTGRFREKELRFAEGTGDVVAELPIDTSVDAEIVDDEVAISGAVEMSEYLAETNALDTCFVTNYFEFVTGREPDPKTDGCDVVALRGQLEASGGSIKGMLRASALADSFRRRMVQ